ncbi:MAG: hypothetical protein ABL895_12945 [Cyclobacteriaceae bacterium]
MNTVCGLVFGGVAVVAGVTLIIGFDKQKSSDLSYSLEGITIYVDKKHTMYLFGKQVDFYEGADARGFMFADQQKMFDQH